VSRDPGRSVCRFLGVGLLLLALAMVLSGCVTAVERPEPTPVPARIGPSGRPVVPNFSHVFIIVMENKEYNQIIGSPQAPYLNQLARTYAVAGRYYGIRHPSLPNYLALISGSTQGMTWDCPDCSFDAPNLVDQLTAHRRTWTAYLEGLPEPCYNGPFAGSLLDYVRGLGYVRRHNPFMYFNDIADNPARCQDVVPFSRFAADLSQNRVSDFVWITPDLSHDMHTGTIQQGDSWLAITVPKILQSAAWREGGVLFITWDEGTTDATCCGDAAGGRVPTLVISAEGKRDYVSPVPYTHYSLLRTVEAAWQLGYLGHAADPGSRPLADFFATHSP
jgi:hypothetical protein